jgi:hypothetical protein
MGGVGVAAAEPVTGKMTLRGGCVHVVDAKMTPNDGWHPRVDVFCNEAADGDAGLVGPAHTPAKLSTRNEDNGQ